MNKRALSSFGLALALLAGCGNDRPVAPPAAATPARAAAKPAPAPALVRGQRTRYDHVDQYKEEVAEHIVSRNTDHTFFGKLPPMLPAIVVLRMTVNGDGRITDLFVQRSRDKQASAVAMASVHRAGSLPRPQNLVHGSTRAITFSETFLFNADYKFQLRSLAPVQ
jgi:periplasmic protein TonB